MKICLRFDYTKLVYKYTLYYSEARKFIVNVVLVIKFIEVQIVKLLCSESCR